MNRFGSILAAVVASVVLLAPSVHAFGIGPVFKYANHSASLEGIDIGGLDDFNATFTTDLDDDDFEIDYDANVIGIGVQLDTNVARNRLFNYRVEILVEFVDGTSEYSLAGLSGSSDDDFAAGGFGINQTFGLGLIRRPGFRLYAGPTLRLGLFGGEGEDIRLGGTELDATDYVGFDLGLGLELGLNLHTGKRTSVSLSVAYVPSASLLFAEDEFDESIYSGYQHRVVAGVSILFRTAGDVF